jgi:hypothetical protein
VEKDCRLGGERHDSTNGHSFTEVESEEIKASKSGLGGHEAELEETECAAAMPELSRPLCLDGHVVMEHLPFSV